VFRTIHAQAVLFTSEGNHHGPRFMSHFLSLKWGDLFNGEPATYEPPKGMPVLSFPRIVLKSEDNLTHLLVSTERIDFVRLVMPDDLESAVDVLAHVKTAEELFAEYRTEFSSKVDRAAVIVVRASENEDPARTISNRFCQTKWVDGPMNRARDFEIASMKRYQMAGAIEVNSWFRCKTGNLVKESRDRAERRAILVEQDLNTAVGSANSLGLSQDEMREFFALAPDELDSVFGFYF
jgi:hypothetical protein